MSHFLSLPIKLVASAVLAFALTSSAHAGASQVFGSQWAWDNNFNNSTINATFGTGSNPSMTVSYNFSSYSLYGYPACIRGWHYGWNPANDNLFPMQVSAATSIPCTFSYTSSGSSMAGDFAYDLFLRWDNAKSTPQLEIMIWGGNDSWPIGTQTGTSVLSAGGWTFDLWEGMNTGAGYYVYTFIPHGTAGVGDLPTSGSVNVDLKPFFNWLQSNRSSSGYYNNTMYLDVVEAGLEITRGNGSAWITANITASTGGTTPNFTLSASPSSLTVNRSSSGTSTINIARTSFTSSVALTASGLPSGVTASFNPSSTTGNSSTLTLTASSTATTGTSTVTITGTGGGLTRTTTISLTVGTGGGGGTIANGTYKIVNRNSGQAMDATGGGTANGTQIIQWPYSGANNQRWTVTSLGSGQYEIIGVQSGKSLDINASGTANGTKVQLWTYNGGNNQKFTITATSGGYYRITPANATGSCLEVSGSSTANGALVDLWSYGGGNNQQWIFQAP